MYSLDKMKQLVMQLTAKGHEVTLFGGGGAEKRIIDEWVRKINLVNTVSAGLGLKGEIELMKGIKQTFDPNNILNPGKIFKA